MKKIIVINGSPRKNGNTSKLLSIIEDGLTKNAIESYRVEIGNKPVLGCIQCGKCKEKRRCAFDDNNCNYLIDALLEAEGIIIGSPVYFSGVNGALCALLDRVFYAASTWHQLFAGKIGAAIVTQYRSGGSSALDRIHKYFFASQMRIVSSSDYLVFPEIKNGKLSEENYDFLKTLVKNIVHITNLQ